MGIIFQGKAMVFHRLGPQGPRDRLSGPPRLGLGQCHQPSAPSAWGPAMATREAAASSVEGAGGAGGSLKDTLGPLGEHSEEAMALCFFR